MKTTLHTPWAALGLAFLLLPTQSPGSPAPVEITAEPDRPLVAGGEEAEIVVRIRVRGADVGRDVGRVPLNLAVVLDRSGSMGGAKIEQARQAATLLLDRLRPDDVFSLVVYDDTVDVLVPPHKGGGRDAARRAIGRLRPGGSTALYDGVRCGAGQLREFFAGSRINRVILLSDGIANVGPSSPRELSALGRELAADGIAVTTVGLGGDYQEDVLSALAEASDANYYYVDDVEALPEIFAQEFGELASIVARNIRIEVSCPDGVTPLGFLGTEGEHVRDLRSVAAGQERDLFFRCRMEAGAAAPAGGVAHVTVKLETADGGRTATLAARPPEVRRTADPGEAERAVNHEVSVAWQLAAANLASDAAVEAADAGRDADAESQLRAQQVRLRQIAEGAPAAMQPRVAEEIEALDESLAEFKEDGQLTPRARKLLRERSFNTRNAK